MPRFITGLWLLILLSILANIKTKTHKCTCSRLWQLGKGRHEFWDELEEGKDTKVLHCPQVHIPGPHPGWGAGYVVILGIWRWCKGIGRVTGSVGKATGERRGGFMGLDSSPRRIPRMHVHNHTHKLTHKHTHSYIYIIHSNIHIFTTTYTHYTNITHTHVHTHIYACHIKHTYTVQYVHYTNIMCINAHIHNHIHTHIYTHIYTCYTNTHSLYTYTLLHSHHTHAWTYAHSILHTVTHTHC